MAKHAHVHLHDAEFNEFDHPRATNGQFGSGGGGGKAPDQPVTMKQKTTPNFVIEFSREFPTGASQEAALKKIPDEKLKTALRLTEGHIDTFSTGFRKQVSAELEARGIAPEKQEAKGAKPQEGGPLGGQQASGAKKIPPQPSPGPAASKTAPASAPQAPATGGKPTPHFVSGFAKEHPTTKAKKQALEALPRAQLEKALKLTEGFVDAATALFRKLISEELDSRANRGA